MATARSSDALDDRLDALAQTVRRQRILGGIALTVLAALFTALAAAALDAAFKLSVPVRCAMEAVWFSLVGFMAWRFALRPLHADPPVEEVAERMMADDSPNVVAALARETKEHRAYPAWPSRSLAASAVFFALGMFVLVATAGERARRLALPWHRPAVAAPFEIVVVSGDAVARRGESITLSAYLKPREPNGVLPGFATLKLRDGEVPMLGAKGAFHATLPPTDGDFEYCVESGDTTSEWFTVRLADAVELTADSAIAIAPPEYVPKAVQPAANPFGDIEALQYSTANLHLKFNRPAESAAIEWRPDGRNSFEAPDLVPIALAADRRSGTATLPLRANGMLRVVLTNESGPRRLRTEAAIGVRIVVDAPPSFERIEGIATKPRTARPGQEIRVAFTATDDLGVASAVLESEKGSVPLLLEKTGTPHAEGIGIIRVPTVEGETLRYRLRIRDSRKLPGENLGAQETVFPPGGWFEVKVSSSGSPFAEQQIIGQRDAVNAVLAAVREKLATCIVETTTLKSDTAKQSPFPLDQAIRLGAIREQLREVRTLLDRGATEARLTTSLAGVAGELTAFSDGTLREADDALQQAVSDNHLVRARFLVGGLKHLGDALEEAIRIGAANDRVAQSRLDRARIADLERRQNALAKSMLDPDAAAKLQRELLAELKRIVHDSEPLNRAATTLAANESARLSGEVRALSGRLRDLDDAAKSLHKELRQTLLAERAVVQLELAKRVEELNKQLESPARVAALARPKREDFERVVGLLQKDKLVEALTELERIATALEKLAADCDAWAADRADAKLAAAQSAKWQADVRTRYIADPKSPLVAEQTAILDATEKLLLPPGFDSQRNVALVHLRLAKRRLETGAPLADVAMKLAEGAFEQLAAKLPSLAERLARGRTDLDKLRKEHDDIITFTERVLATFEKLQPTVPVMQNIAVKLGPLHTRQLKLSDKLFALDLPTHEARQARALSAVKAAAADLKDGLPFDVVASLGAARRELDRLKQALENQVPADDRSAELAAKQAEALRLVLAAGEAATVKQWEPVIALQQEVANGIGMLTVPEAPALLHEAREATRLAESALRDGSSYEQIVRRLRDAKEATSLLADRIADREPERERIRRFIALRRTAECAARKLAGKPLNPDASTEAREAVKRELDELLMTRVGAAGQAAKKKAFEAYFRLASRTEPDRQAADHKQLAEALAELAGLMAGTAQLSTRPEAEPAAGDPTEPYLPSRRHAESLREMARSERSLRERVNSVAAEVTVQLKPAAINPFTTLEAAQRSLADSAAAFARQQRNLWQAARAWQIAADTRRAADRLAVGDGNEFKATTGMIAVQQQARHATLAAQARELHQQFAAAIADAAAIEPGYAEAADRLQAAERLLSDASRSSAADAVRLRAEAITLIRQAAVPGAPRDRSVPDPTAVSLQNAERAMLRAIRECGPKGDPKAALEAMNRAATALRTEVR